MFPGIQAYDVRTQRTVEAGNDKITRDDVMNLYVREMKENPTEAADLLETLNVIIGLIPQNKKDVVRTNGTYSIP